MKLACSTLPIRPYLTDKVTFITHLVPFSRCSYLYEELDMV